MYNEDGLSPENQIPTPNLEITDENAFLETPEDRLCPPLWDTLSCFPVTPAGRLRVIPCAAEIRTVHDGVEYITSLDTTREFLYDCNDMVRHYLLINKINFLIYISITFQRFSR